MEARQGRPAKQFYDLQFEDFQRDPLGSIADIYDHFELPLSERAENAMASFRSDNPRGKHGEHRYTQGDWGLEAEDIRERFQPYIERFGIPSETS